MTQMTYRDLGHALYRCSFENEHRYPLVEIETGDVVDILVEFFRSNDPDFNEGEFVGSTYGA